MTSKKKTVLDWFTLADRAVNRIEEWVLGSGILVMAGLTVINVFARNVFGNSLAFVDEINTVLIILITFAGIGYAARQGRHIRMTAIYDQLNDRWRKIFMLVISASTSALMFALAFYAAVYVQHAWEVKSNTAALRIPLYLVYMVVPIGLALGGVQYLFTFVRNIISREVYVSFSHKDEYETPEESMEGYI